MEVIHVEEQECPSLAVNQFFINVYFYELEQVKYIFSIAFILFYLSLMENPLSRAFAHAVPFT